MSGPETPFARPEFDDAIQKMAPSDSDCTLDNVCAYIEQLAPWVDWADAWIDNNSKGDQADKPDKPVWPPA